MNMRRMIDAIAEGQRFNTGHYENQFSAGFRLGALLMMEILENSEDCCQEADEEKTEASRQEIAFRLGVNHITYYGWVSGSKLPSPANLFKLADYFGVKPSDLLQ